MVYFQPENALANLTESVIDQIIEFLWFSFLHTVFTVICVILLLIHCPTKCCHLMNSFQHTRSLNKQRYKNMVEKNTRIDSDFTWIAIFSFKFPLKMNKFHVLLMILINIQYFLPFNSMCYSVWFFALNNYTFALDYFVESDINRNCMCPFEFHLIQFNCSYNPQMLVRVVRIAFKLAFFSQFVRKKANYIAKKKIAFLRVNKIFFFRDCSANVRWTSLFDWVTFNTLNATQNTDGKIAWARYNIDHIVVGVLYLLVRALRRRQCRCVLPIHGQKVCRHRITRRMWMRTQGTHTVQNKYNTKKKGKNTHTTQITLSQRHILITFYFPILPLNYSADSLV